MIIKQVTVCAFAFCGLLMVTKGQMQADRSTFQYFREPEGGFPSNTVVETASNRDALMQERVLVFKEDVLQVVAVSGEEDGDNKDRGKFKARTVEGHVYWPRALKANITVTDSNQTAVVVFGYQGPTDFYYAGVYNGKWDVGHHTGMAFEVPVAMTGEVDTNAINYVATHLLDTNGVIVSSSTNFFRAKQPEKPALFIAGQQLGQDTASSRRSGTLCPVIGKSYEIRAEVREKDLILYGMSADGQVVVRMVKQVKDLPRGLRCGTATFNPSETVPIIEKFHIGRLYGYRAFPEKKLNEHKWLNFSESTADQEEQVSSFKVLGSTYINGGKQ